MSSERTGVDPWKKAKRNILDFFRRKPKPPTPQETELILMTLKMNELLPFIKDLIADFIASKEMIKALLAKIAEMEAERAAEIAVMEDAKAMITAARDVGGSMGGIV